MNILLIPGAPLRVCLFLVSVTILSCHPKSNSPLNNRLANASSPYLREHADNPVDWYEWGDEALSRAQREGKPLLVSIGYASCHWCHVMEEETFMDTAVARVMNQNFVCIKVDREERPDIDQIFINAAQLISGNAGWPLNAFALPDGRPFYASTYFPKAHWLQLIKQVAQSYADDERSLRKQAAAIVQNVRDQHAWLPSSDSVPSSTVSQQEIFEDWSRFIDPYLGGLSGAPKFPMPVIWEFLLQHHYLSKEPSSLKLVLTTFDAMIRGGIYDQLGGGFSRYSTDSLWRIPHFEKMLYDNAQLIKLYAEVYQITGDPEYENIAKESLEFVKRELTDEKGLFWSSINADSQGHEGMFYVWTMQEIDQALSREAALAFSSTYNVTAAGNWQGGVNVLFKTNPSDSAMSAPASDGEGQKLLKLLEDSRAELLAIRNRRIRPTTDTKTITSWNAMMIEAYLQAFDAFGDEQYLRAAITAATALQKERVNKSGHVKRTTDSTRPGVEGFLDDYALLCRAFVRLYHSTFDIRYLNTARLVADYVLDNFRDERSGLFFYSLNKSVRGIAKNIETADEVMPSSNAVFAEALFLLGEYYQDERYQEVSAHMVDVMSVQFLKEGPYYASWARLKGLQESGPFEVAVMGEEAARVRGELMKKYLPTVILSGGTEENLPLLESKYVEGKTLIYVCRNRVCKFPVEDVAMAMQQLK